MKGRERYLEELLSILNNDDVDVYIKEPAKNINDLANAYSKALYELPDGYQYVSFVDDDDLVCNGYYRMLFDNIESDSSAISANQIQFKKSNDIADQMNNKMRGSSYKTSHLSYHGPSLICVDSLKKHINEFKQCKIDVKRFIIKLFHKHGKKTQFCPQVGSFWRIRDLKGNYYE